MAALRVGLLASVPFLCLSSASSDPPPARVLQTLAVFDRPESVAFDLEGERLFVGSCGSDLFGPDLKKVGFVAGRGTISALSVGADGTVEMVERRLVEGLDGPLGLGVLPVATERYPRGTLLALQGLALLVDGEGASVTDAERLGTALLFFDPKSGEPLGEMDLGVGGAVARELGHAVLMPNSLAFDRAGNLYFTDSARGGDRLVPALPPHPGLVRVPHGSIDDPSKGGLSFTPLAGIPNGAAYSAVDDAILVVTMGGGEPRGEALYKLSVASFPIASEPEPFQAGIGTMDGVDVTPAGTILVSRFSGDVLAVPRDGAPFPLRLEPETPLVTPADHRVLALADGTTLLAVPEQARNERPAGVQRLRILRLPAGF